MIFLRVKALIIAVLIAVIITGITAYWYHRGVSKKELIWGVPESIKLLSPAFANNSNIPRKYSCDGIDLSPPLNWSSPPPGTKALAILVYDLDAPHGIFYHWLIYDLNPSLRGLPAGVPKVLETLYGMQGINSFNRAGYGGPCPPKGELHHYVFLIVALNSTQGLRPGLKPQEFLNVIKGHVIAYGLLVGLYRR